MRNTYSMIGARLRELFIMEPLKQSFAILLVCLISLTPTAGQALDGFEIAKPKKEIKPRYPVGRFSDYSEVSRDDGQIEMYFVVNADGSVSAPMVVRTSMTKFIEPTLRALENSTFEPAKLNGTPVVSTVKQTFFFEYTALDTANSRGNKTSFLDNRQNSIPDGYQSFYTQFTKEISKAKPSQKKAANLLRRMHKLKHQSFYSLTYHSLARYRFAQKFQGRQEVIAALKDLVWFDPQVSENFQILKSDLKDAIWTSLLQHQIQEGQYAEALETYSKFSELRPGGEMPFSDSIEQINTLKQSNQVVQRAIFIPDRGYTQLPLLKNSFTFIDLEGSITGLTLRCDARYTELSYQADVDYELPLKWGACNLQISGTAGTTSKILLN